MKRRALDLFCCAGGMSMGLARAGFTMHGIDIDPQPRYPFEFARGSATRALEMLLAGYPIMFFSSTGRYTGSLVLDDFDFIHASPPCQDYLNLAKVNEALGRKPKHERLIAETRELLQATGLPYVIENVADARPELIDPVRVCGTAFGLPLRRHRFFESNVPLEGKACEHQRFTEKRYWTSYRPNGRTVLSTVVQVYGNGGNQHEWPAAMGIDWMTSDELREAIPPAYGEHIGRQVMAHIDAQEAAA